jgi:anti-sigma-K factor RskA
VNKRFISYLTLVTFTIASIPGKADISEEVQQQVTENNTAISSDSTEITSSIETETVDDDYATPEGTDVKKKNNENENKARKQMWINIGLAITAVVVAVVALCLVSNNNGHHHKS